MSELPNDQPHQSPEQSHAEDHTEQIEVQAEKIIAEEQVGFRTGRNTTEQIFNFRILCEQDLYHVSIYFKKALDRIWLKGLWATEEVLHQR